MDFTNIFEDIIYSLKHSYVNAKMIGRDSNYETLLADFPLFPTYYYFGMVAAFVSDSVVVFSVLPWWTGVSKLEHYSRKVDISITTNF
jgi:hypothetical protein